jgi:hypothetical protein
MTRERNEPLFTSSQTGQRLSITSPTSRALASRRNRLGHLSSFLPAIVAHSYASQVTSAGAVIVSEDDGGVGQSRSGCVVEARREPAGVADVDYLGALLATGVRSSMSCTPIRAPTQLLRACGESYIPAHYPAASGSTQSVT